MKHMVEDRWRSMAAAYSEWVIDRHLVVGLYPRFANYLVPQLQGRLGVRILDIASASGEPAATLAGALPDAQVLSTDLAAPFLELGRARAAKQGMQNILFETADAEDLRRYADASFDAVTCSLGLMFMPNFETALRELARVLKPGGLFAATVWGVAERCRFFKITEELALEYDADSVPAAASSITYRFGDPAAELLPAMMTAGLEGARVTGFEVSFTMPAHTWWQEMLSMPLPIKPALTKASEARPGEDVFEEAHLKMAAALQQNGWLTEDDSLHCRDNACWFVTAQKPSSS